MRPFLEARHDLTPMEVEVLDERLYEISRAAMTATHRQWGLGPMETISTSMFG